LENGHYSIVAFRNAILDTEMPVTKGCWRCQQAAATGQRPAKRTPPLKERRKTGIVIAVVMERIVLVLLLLAKLELFQRLSAGEGDEGRERGLHAEIIQLGYEFFS
jgi:hypothetical protein